MTYLLLAAQILVVYHVSALRDRFYIYGPRSHAEKTTPDKARIEQRTKVEELLDGLMSYKVPHSWFLHFYIVSVITSIIWMQQIYTGGSLFHAVAAAVPPDLPSMSCSQVLLCWTLYTIQGSRRLFECIMFGKKSKSEMWVGHYLLGLLYYIAMGIAIWVEGAPALQSSADPLRNLHIQPPSFLTFVFLSIFLFASGIQFDTHQYLSSMQQYAVPTHPAFERIVSPHYTTECAIYLALIFIAAPQGYWINKTLFTVLLFVVVELGVAAEMTRRWYVSKFGPASVDHKFCMIPGVW